MDWDPSSFRRQRSYVAATTGSRLSRFIDKEYEHENEVSMPYYQMGGRKKKGWFGMWKRIITRRKKKVLEGQSNTTERYYRCNPAYDPWSYKQNFDGGSARMEPENLSWSFSVQFANSSGFLQWVR